MKFCLEIEVGNDAMKDVNDLSAELKKVSEDILRVNTEIAIVMDENGNTVGKWWFE